MYKYIYIHIHIYIYIYTLFSVGIYGINLKNLVISLRLPYSSSRDVTLKEGITCCVPNFPVF